MRGWHFEWWGNCYPMWGWPGARCFSIFDKERGGGAAVRRCILGPLWIRKVLWET